MKFFKLKAKRLIRYDNYLHGYEKTLSSNTAPCIYHPFGKDLYVKWTEMSAVQVMSRLPSFHAH